MKGRISLSQHVPALTEWSLKQLVVLLPRSVQIARVVLEGGHLDPITQPLDLKILEIVVLVVLDDYLLQFTYLTLHPGTKLTLHLQQSLQTLVKQTN